MRNKNLLLVILICAMTFISVQAQTKSKTEANADIVEYTNKDGLPTSNFSNIIQTKDGYLWISSVEGTYRFDGYEFEEVGREFGVPKMQAVYYDSSLNTLYFASPTKFVIFNGERFKVFGKDEGYKLNGLEGQTVNFIQADSKGRIWIGSSTPYIDREFNGALTKYENGQFTVYDSTSFPLHNANGFIETPYGDIIFTSAGKNTRSFSEAYIALYKNDTFKRIDETLGIDVQNVMLRNQDLNRIIDEDGNTWIAFSGTLNSGDRITVSHSGVLMYDGNSFHQYPGLEKYINNNVGIWSVHYDKFENKVYATAYEPNSEIFNSHNKMIFELKDGEWINSNIINSIGSVKNLSTNESMVDLRYLNTLFVDDSKYFPELLSFIVTDRNRGGRGSKYLNQYFTHNKNEWEKIDAFEGVPMQELDDGLLLSTINGFGIYYPKDYKLFTEDEGFLSPNSFIPTLYSDKNGIVWISYSMSDLPAYLGVYNVGINIWDGNNLIAVTEKDGLSGNATFNTFHDSKNRILIPTTKGVTLCREIQNSKGEWLFKFEKIYGNTSDTYNATNLLETSKGDIYAWQTAVGSTFDNFKPDYYLGRFDGEKFIEIPSPFDDELRMMNSQFIELREAPDGNLLLEGIFSNELLELTTARTYIMVYKDGHWSKAPDKWKIPGEQLHYVGTLDNGMYYLTVNGFYNFNGTEFINLIDSVDANANFSLLKGASVAGTKTDNQADGKLFIRLRDRGLVIFDGTHLHFYTKKNGLPSANLYNPNPDSKGNIMFSHPSGALIVKDEKFQNYYDEGSNLTGGANVTTLDGNGNLVMHYRGIGLLIKQQDHNTYPLKLSSVIIDTASYFYKFPEDLSHTENSLIFNFAVLNYKDPKQTNYEYKLEGYDKDWSRPGNLSFAQYQNLPTGSYTFRVKGISSNGVKTNEASYSFIIAPPYWRTTFAYIAYGIFLVLGVFGVDRFQRRRLLAKARERARIKESEMRAQIAEAENERKTKELEEARDLQLSMLPKDLPNLPNLDIAVYMQTATEVGGDYYDFHVGMDGTLTVVVGDATGHGMKAGTMVTTTKSLFNILAPNPDILTTFSEISRVIKGMKFHQLSMCLMLLKIKGDQLFVSSAAMPPALIYRKKNRAIEEIFMKGMPLGAMDNFPYSIKESHLETGDTILLLSDGLPELTNDSNEMYGYDKTKKEFHSVGEKEPEEIVDHLKNSASQWLNGKEPDDDVTFVVIKVK